jgi:D-beta-D-heptose 7-phosphate kinase/D-beta-D-heptose 1-phosphate adenosyltransferase
VTNITTNGNMTAEEALKIINGWRKAGHKIYLTSGGFDPLHVGHLKCIQETAWYAHENNGKVLILVNGDQFLIEKKGKPFMKINERLAIVDGLKGVDLAIEWYDGCQTVDAAIKLFEPDYFTKGGDRDDPEVIPEWSTCQNVGCKVILGVGGGKIQSSSWLVKNST